MLFLFVILLIALVAIINNQYVSPHKPQVHELRLPVRRNRITSQANRV